MDLTTVLGSSSHNDSHSITQMTHARRQIVDNYSRFSRAREAVKLVPLSKLTVEDMLEIQRVELIHCSTFEDDELTDEERGDMADDLEAVLERVNSR